MNRKQKEEILHTKRILENYKSIVFYDLETTGFSRTSDRILQFSAMRYSIPEWKKMEELDLYIQSPFQVDGLPATSVNGITDALLEEKGLFEYDAYQKISKFIHSDDLIAGYNNNSFDDPFLTQFYKTCKSEFRYGDSLDVLKFAKSVLEPEDFPEDELGNRKPCYKLGFLTELFDKENTYQFHNSLDDVAATAFLFQMLLQKVKDVKLEPEIERKKEIPTEEAKILSVRIFHPSRNLKRVYVNTDQGSIYYDDIKKEWRSKTGKLEDDVLQKLIRRVYRFLNISADEFVYAAAEKMDN